MPRKILSLVILMVALALAGCTPPGRPLVLETSSKTTTYDDTIQMNNCGNKASSTQTKSRSFATSVSGTGTLKAGYDIVVEAGISATYGQYKNTTVTQELTAAPETNMEFVLRWSDDVRAGNVTFNGESTNYEVIIPVSVSQISSQNLPCPTPVAAIASATTTATASTDIAALVGDWVGTATNDQNGNHTTIQISIQPGCVLNAVCGTIQVPDIPCRGNLELTQINDGAFTFIEQDVTGGSPICTSGGKDLLQVLPDGTVSREFSPPGQSVITHAILRHP